MPDLHLNLSEAPCALCLGSAGALVTVVHGSEAILLDRFLPPYFRGWDQIPAGPAGAGIWSHPRKQGGQNRSKNRPPEPCTIVTKAPADPTYVMQ